VYFQRLSGTTFQFVQYRGAASAMQDLVGGHIDLMFDQPPNSLPHVRDGSIKAYAVTAKRRLASAPEIPTVDEGGLPEFYVSVWSGMWAPKGTPEAVVSKLNSAVVDAWQKGLFSVDWRIWARRFPLAISNLRRRHCRRRKSKGGGRLSGK
jgi:tripartite-type tricarboxylate transporter receptor subunit TctC